MDKFGVFVIMPFAETQSRNKSDLDEFFNTNIKGAIEDDIRFKDFANVTRSGDRFDITEDIVMSVARADFVICDLSGTQSNPNVMYELGMRLSLSDKPTILIRESDFNNRKIFDIQGFYTHEYSITKYRKLENWLTNKLYAYTSGQEYYQSPVLKVLQQDPLSVTKFNAARLYRLLTALLTQFRTLQKSYGGALNKFR